MQGRFVLIGLLLLVVLAGYSLGPANSVASGEPASTGTSTSIPSPPPPPTAPAAPDVSGVWDVTRSWFRRCPGPCYDAVIRGTRWEITQMGNEIRVDRGLHGTIEGYDVHLEGIETNGFDRLDFYYSRLRLSPDGLVITGQFVGQETIQNPCDVSPPSVTCFVDAGDFYAVRRSPLPTVVPPSATPSPTATQTPTATVTPVPTQPPTTTPSATASPTEISVNPATVYRRYLPLVARPAAD